MKKNNIIPFPKQNINPTAETNLEEIQHNVEMMKLYHIQEAIVTIAPIIFNQLDIAGFYLSEDETIDDLKSGAMIIESIRALMCKHYGVYHPFQDIADTIFEPNDEDDEGGMKIAESINLVFKKEDEDIEESE